MNENRLPYLLSVYVREIATDAECTELFDLIAKEKEDVLQKAAADIGLEVVSERTMDKEVSDAILASILTISKQPGVSGRKVYRMRLGYWLTTAAAIIALLVGVWWWRSDHQQSNNNTVINSLTANGMDISPGGDRATLTLADGSQILLDSMANGTLAQQGATKLVKTNGQLIYRAGATGKQDGVLAYNTIRTPQRGQYQLVLPDGTRVWLNAESSLKYPVAFTSQMRTVELSGEAYFEVAPRQKQMQSSKNVVPFTVQITNALGVPTAVQVLGTHFNINAYGEEPALKATLLQGKVKVIRNQQERLLKPGEQAIIANNTNNSIVLQPADLEEAIAWKEGRFYFNSTPLITVIRQLERWYGIKVSYNTGDLSTVTFSGTISRMNNISDVLRMLELTGVVRFNLEDGQIQVHRNN